jgi:hypothetical protein
VIVALLRGRGSASRAWCNVGALSDAMRDICSAADAHSCEAAAELLDTLAAEMDKSVAEALRARGELPGAIERIATAAPSHWCRVMLLSAVYRFILHVAEFRSSLCRPSVVRAAQAAMMETKDDYECGAVANAVGELVRGHDVNKAAFSCEATCMGLMRMAEAAVEQVTVQVSFCFPFNPRCSRDTCAPQDIAFLISSLHSSSSSPSIPRSAPVSAALLILYIPPPRVHALQRCSLLNFVPLYLRLNRCREDASVEQVCVAIQSYYERCGAAVDDEVCRTMRTMLPKVMQNHMVLRPAHFSSPGLLPGVDAVLRAFSSCSGRPRAQAHFGQVCDRLRIKQFS